MEQKNRPYNQLKLKLNNFFGKEKEGMLAYRIFDIAYIDVIITLIVAFFIQKSFCPKTEYYKKNINELESRFGVSIETQFIYSN